MPQGALELSEDGQVSVPSKREMEILLLAARGMSNATLRAHQGYLEAWRLTDDASRQLRAKARDICGHRLLSVVPVVSVRVEGGYVGRCLMCGMTGPVRSSEQAARRDVVLEQVVLNEG